jgi:hypothetical protein
VCCRRVRIAIAIDRPTAAMAPVAAAIQRVSDRHLPLAALPAKLMANTSVAAAATNQRG